MYSLWQDLSNGTMSWPWPWPLTYFKVKFVAERGTTILWICLLLYFFLARFARQYYKTYYIYTYFQVQCSVLNGHPFSNISLIQIMKRIQLPISCFYERAFLYFSRLELHDFTPFKPKIFWGEPPDPFSTLHSQYQKPLCHMCGCVERLSITKRPVPIGNKVECK